MMGTGSRSLVKGASTGPGAKAGLNCDHGPRLSLEERLLPCGYLRTTREHGAMGKERGGSISPHVVEQGPEQPAADDTRIACWDDDDAVGSSTSKTPTIRAAPRGGLATQGGEGGGEGSEPRHQFRAGQ